MYTFKYILNTLTNMVWLNANSLNILWTLYWKPHTLSSVWYKKGHFAIFLKTIWGLGACYHTSRGQDHSSNKRDGTVNDCRFYSVVEKALVNHCIRWQLWNFFCHLPSIIKLFDDVSLFSLNQQICHRQGFNCNDIIQSLFKIGFLSTHGVKQNTKIRKLHYLGTIYIMELWGKFRRPTKVSRLHFCGRK